MSIKYVSIAGQYVLRETAYTDDSYNLYNRYATAKARKRPFKQQKTTKLLRRMRKTEPRGRVLRRLIDLKIEFAEREFRKAPIAPVKLSFTME